MDDLIEFVKARLNEDERVARRVKASWRLVSAETGVILASDGRNEEECASANWGGVGEHIVRHDPERVLRDVHVAAKTVARCQEEMLSGIPRLVHFAQQTLWEMAQRWADHADFRPELRP